jgi:hypothetical protein
VGGRPQQESNIERLSFSPSSPPSEENADTAASRLREAIGVGAAREFREAEMSALFEWGRFDVCVTNALDSAHGGAEALLVPLEDDRFSIIVDPQPLGGWGPVDGAERERLERRRVRFRVAHEVAHSLFYERAAGTKPWRAHAATEIEERFCDRFAAALLLPPSVVAHVQLTGAAVQQLADSFDVSLHAVVRSLATYHLELASVSLVVDRGIAPFVQWRSERVGDSPMYIRSPARRESVEWLKIGSQLLGLERKDAATAAR